MIVKLFLGLLCLSYAYRGHENVIPCDVYEQAYLAMDKLISHNPEILPTLVRAAFHDCVGAACDGCMNFNDPHNAGLAPAIGAIDQIFENDAFYYHFSRADWWQLAAHVALVRGGLNQGCSRHSKCSFFELQYWYGRKDCRTSPYHHQVDDAGSPHGDYQELWRVLNGNFGVNHHELVALLGAHSLGGAHRDASGFNYKWQSDYLVFDNQYYKNMISLPYQVEDVSGEDIDGHTPPGDTPPLLQFVCPLPENISDVTDLMLLNTDLSLFKDINALRNDDGEFTGQTTCRMGRKVKVLPENKPSKIRKCTDAPTATIVYEFAQSLDAFYATFTDAWWKMVSHGNEDVLRTPKQDNGDCGFCIPEGAYCVSGFEKAGACCPGSRCVQHKCSTQ